jgi:hypothetical protein
MSAQRHLLRALLPGLLLLGGPELPAHGQSGAEPGRAGEKPAPSSGPASEGSRAPSPGGDPFARLRVVTPREKLPPLASVRVRDKREADDRSRKGQITITVGSAPKGASVYYGGKLLGATPLTLTAQRGSTPLDVVIRRPGYMTLRTRLMRKVSHGYFFKLTPAKLH